jgi:predicted alpha/beta hydrolase family esterase
MQHELSSRDPETTVVPFVESGPAIEQHRTAPHLVIFIHGYQNSEKKARRSYEKFEAKLDAAIPGGVRRMGAIWWCHWKGDHPLGLISMATYPIRVETAKLAGAELADWVEKRSPLQHVTIVAHSLGCRVALHAVMKIRAAGSAWKGAHVDDVFLLAAAVPVRLCVPTSNMYGARRERSAEHVFHSRSDVVLAGAFRPGQYLVGERGPAVGRHGKPDYRWTSREETGLAHGDYWKSSDVAIGVAELLGLRPWRSIEERRLPRASSFLERAGLEGREIPARGLVPRPI